MRVGQLLLPMVKLIEQSEKAIDEVIDVAGRTAIAGTVGPGEGRSQVAG